MWNSAASAADRSVANGRVNNELCNVATLRDGLCLRKGHAQNNLNIRFPWSYTQSNQFRLFSVLNLQ